jgi:hypothetical protein
MRLNNYLDFLGNLYDCPFGRRMPDCPMYPLKYDSFKEKLEWFGNLPKENKDMIVGHHQECKVKREKKYLHF